MTDHLKALDAAAELKRLIPRPNNGMIAQLEQMDRRQEYNKAASEIDHAAIAAAWRAKNAEIERYKAALTEIARCAGATDACWHCRDLATTALTPLSAGATT